MSCTLARWFNLKLTCKHALTLGIVGAHWLFAASASVAGSVVEDRGRGVPRV